VIIMKTQKIILEVNANLGGVAHPTCQARDMAVRQAKKDVWDEVDARCPGLEVSGLNTLFPVMVISGPIERLQMLSGRVKSWLPNRIRKVEAAWTAKIF